MIVQRTKERLKVMSFGDVERGELFSYENDLYIRVLSPEPVNAVRLDTGVGIILGSKTLVTAVDYDTLVWRFKMEGR